ncbi:NAD(P)H-hydrate dehydratase [uncultured Duncaniella sp.]|uniref:NAD(P)H-hydrate dehydratase n=1 Tax=uncultured Duncaniella sp. TaxID=2768039 RepID=UPI0026757F14|nr:NAD(P)H-hydrate dehydratase [uncultured Duncaniella sp.]MCI9171806.1 NAD(P)H-hydrate dehydratase [Muribaculaceae bacterium]
MKIFNTENIRKIDRVTIEEEGVSSQELIRRVAEGVVSEIVGRWSPSTPVVIFAGSGNNGADALVVGRLLLEAGFYPRILLFNFKGNSLSRDCRQAKHELLSTGYQGLVEIIDRADIPPITPDHLVIDGLFGSGLRDPLEGGFKMLARVISESGASVISIDVPSGMFGDWNARVIGRDVVHATLTLAVQFPRLAFFLSDNADLVGRWKVLDIGLSNRAIMETHTKYFYVERDEVREVLRKRKPFSSKADYGHALLFAGCYGMTGAAVLAARGALRSGVGKLTVHSARAAYPVLQSQVPEALFSPDRQEYVISDMSSRFKCTAIGVGPGIGANDVTRGAFETLIKSYKRPMVIDADALNALAQNQALLDHIAPGSILTPHAGEFDRIFGDQTSAEARLLKAIEVSHRYKIMIVLKGHYTATVRPDGKVFFNSSGTPAMATAGSGDVLTGIITSLLAQGYKPEAASVAGVYIHGRAGEIAAETEGDYGTTALDIAQAVGKAIKSIME